MTGHDLSKEGAAMAPILFPDATEHAAARVRLAKRFRPMLNSPNPTHRDIGFFLFGRSIDREAGAMINFDTLRLNGAANQIDTPYPFLDELHGVLCCIERGFGDEDGDGRLNREIMCAAVRGAQTLAFLVSAGLHALDDNKEASDA
jgi:hypothetical protein